MILTVTFNPCVDKTVFVRVNEVGRIIRADSVKCIAGGKGVNVARVLKNLGTDVLAFVILGGHTGEIIRDLAEQEGIKLHVVWISQPSRTVITVLETSTGVQTAYVEPGPSVSDREKRGIWAELQRLIPLSDMMILSGSSPCPNLDELYGEVIRLANDLGVRTILDSRGEALRAGLRAAPFMIKPNSAETEEALGFSPRDERLRVEALRAYVDMGVELPILSLGREGAWMWWEGRIYSATPPPVREVNPVGSGDSMVAGIAYGLSVGMDPVESLRLGVAAGAANAAIWDAASCTRTQINSLLNGVRIHTIG